MPGDHLGRSLHFGHRFPYRTRQRCAALALCEREPLLSAHRLSVEQQDLLYANFNYADFDSSYGYSPNSTYSNTSASTNGPTSYHERFLIAHWTSTLSSSSVNDLRFQWGRDLETAGANAPGPSVGMGAMTYGMPNALPRIAEPDEHRLQFTDVFSKVFSRHTIKFGGDVNLVHEVMINLFQVAASTATPAT